MLHTKRRIGLGLMTSTLLAASPALARPAETEPQATTVSDVVVTASATGVDVRDAPASVSVITREEIERQPVQSLGELLGRLPGVTGGVSPTGAMSKITIRGLPDNYTLVLVDGRRVGNSRDISYRPDLGRQDLNWISPDMIERIEVVRGPMSSLYGSGCDGRGHQHHHPQDRPDMARLGQHQLHLVRGVRARRRLSTGRQRGWPDH